MNKIFTYIISGLIIAGLVYCLGYALGYNSSEKKCLEKDPVVITIKEPITVHDTITNVQYKYKYIDRYDTCYFHTTDTIVDSVEVLVPIERYKIDTTLADSVRIQETIDGFKVEVKEIEVSYHKENTTVIIQPTEEKRFRWGFGLALGFGFIYN